MLNAGPILLVVTLGAAVADWIAVATGNKRAEYVLKPLTLALLLAAAATFRGGEPFARWTFTLAALAFSLLGDVMLMLPRDLLRGGLAAFLVAHLAYIAAFNPSLPPVLPTLPVGLVLLAFGAGLFFRMRTGMILHGHAGLVPAVGAYVFVICAMVASAVGTAGRRDWNVRSSALAIVGAGLFFVSDALIGWTRFVGEVRWGRVLVMVAYHLGQIGLVLGLLG
jgi:uncharacterized membrane protein YhhN